MLEEEWKSDWKGRTPVVVAHNSRFCVPYHHTLRANTPNHEARSAEFYDLFHRLNLRETLLEQQDFPCSPICNTKPASIVEHGLWDGE